MNIYFVHKHKTPWVTIHSVLLISESVFEATILSIVQKPGADFIDVTFLHGPHFVWEFAKISSLFRLRSETAIDPNSEHKICNYHHFVLHSKFYFSSQNIAQRLGWTRQGRWGFEPSWEELSRKMDSWALCLANQYETVMICRHCRTDDL